MVDNEFDHSIMVVHFFRETYSSSYQSSEPCSKSGVDAFYSLGKLLADQMLVVGQHGTKRLPIISAVEVYLKTL